MSLVFRSLLLNNQNLAMVFFFCFVTDVVYDPSLVTPLCKVLNSFFEKKKDISVIFACTIRNQGTHELFLETLGKMRSFLLFMYYLFYFLFYYYYLLFMYVFFYFTLSL